MPREVQPRRRTLRFMIGIGAIGALVYVVVALAADATRLREALMQLGVAGSVGVLACSAANYLLRFIRWQKYLRTLGHRLPTGLHLLYYLSGFAFTVSPGKVGEAVRSLYVKDHGVPVAQSLAALFVERLLDLFAMVMLASLVALANPALRPFCEIALVLALAALIVVTRSAFHRQLSAWASRVRRPRIAALLSGVAGMLRASHALLMGRVLLQGMGIGLASWGAEGLGFYWICHALLLPVTAVAAVGIYGLAMLAGAAAVLLPAGIGGMEVVMTGLLVSHGSSLSAAVIATLLCRLATLWFAVIIGICAAALIEARAQGVPVAKSP